MTYYGKHNGHKFNESNPYILRRLAKEEARKKAQILQDAEEAKKPPPIQDITNDPI